LEQSDQLWILINNAEDFRVTASLYESNFSGIQ